jgi:hypothetical protein
MSFSNQQSRVKGTADVNSMITKENSGFTSRSLVSFVVSAFVFA